MLVCGGRGYLDAERIDRVLDVLGPSLVIHGDARGADSMAANWAAKRGVPHKLFQAEWQRLGKVAGPLRNRQMLREGKPDLVVAFPGGAGTADMVGASMQNGVPVVELK
jgi:hypothetical protein